MPMPTEMPGRCAWSAPPPRINPPASTSMGSNFFLFFMCHLLPSETFRSPSRVRPAKSGAASMLYEVMEEERVPYAQKTFLHVHELASQLLPKIPPRQGSKLLLLNAISGSHDSSGNWTFRCERKICGSVQG